MRLTATSAAATARSVLAMDFPQFFRHSAPTGASKVMKDVPDAGANAMGPSFKDLAALCGNGSPARWSRGMHIHGLLVFGAVNGAMVGRHEISTMNNEDQ